MKSFLWLFFCVSGVHVCRFSTFDCDLVDGFSRRVVNEHDVNECTRWRKALRMPPSGVSYSKWDRIETSDDESEPAATQPLEPLLESRKRNADRDSDEALAKRFIGHLQQHSKVPVPPALRELVARFVAVTDKRENASNTFRYADIIAFGARYQTELVNRGMVDALCELHRQMLDGVKLESPNPPKDAVVADMHKLMDAINTLEALRTTTHAAHFFEQVCGWPWMVLDGLGWPQMASGCQSSSTIVCG